MPHTKTTMTTQPSINNISHKNQKRKNLPSAEQQPIVHPNIKKTIQIAYQRRNKDLDPQLVWRGKEAQDQSDLYIEAPPLYIQERIHPKALIQDLIKQSQANSNNNEAQPDLFADFNGLPHENAKTEFYQHNANWSNRMILGDSMQVMASLAEREAMRNKIQCIYIDPPYGIKFNSNFQWSTTSRDVRDGNAKHITREPEQVKAFRDTWRDGIHSYLSYLRDRLTVARDLLTDSGSIFVQIGDENVHRVRSIMDEVFGDDNFVSLITYRTTSGTTQQNSVKRISDYIIWYCKDSSLMKFRRLLQDKPVNTKTYNQVELPDGTRRSMTTAERADPSKCPEKSRPYRKLPMHSMGSGDGVPRECFGNAWHIPSARHWSFTLDGFTRLLKSDRISPDKTALSGIYYHDDYLAYEIANSWEDTGPVINKNYVVETSSLPIERCILMTTDPGDIVLDPTCGSGTTAYVAEQWGRRWITIDTSRVALALARARIMGARYPYYLLKDSHEGQLQETQMSRTKPADTNTANDIRHGFVYQRVSHITLGGIAHNSEIDIIHEEFQGKLEPLRLKLNQLLNTNYEEWQIPRNPEDNNNDNPEWSEETIKTHAEWWKLRIQRQKEIDTSIAANAEHEYLYDKPYEDRKKVRVAGPFTVESIAPHRILEIDENDNIIDKVADNAGSYGYDFATIILENLRKSGVQQTQKQNKINFTSITNWPGNMICADARYNENNNHPQNNSNKQQDEYEYTDADEDSATEKRAAIFIGPEFGTVQRADIIQAAREAAEAQFDMLITCAFNYEAHTTELDNYGYMPVLKARMNADLHMAADLKPTQAANLFVIFGEPDIEIQKVSTQDEDHPDRQNYTNNQQQTETDDTQYIRIKVKGVDVFHPGTGQIHSDGTDGIACWFIDTDYNEEQFFVRHAYFLGASNDPYKALKTTLKAQINQQTWQTIKSDTSRPFPIPASHRIAIKIINHLGDETIKTFKT